MTEAPDRLDDVWNALDFPVLKEAVRGMSGGARFVQYTDIAKALQLDKADVAAALVRLNTRYLEVKVSYAFGGTIVSCAAQGVTEPGLREVGMWSSPEAVADRLIAALEALIDNTAEGSPKQSRLRAARDGLLGAGRDIMVEIAGAAITGRLPLG